MKLESYEIQKIHRSQIKNAPYNPRVISDDNRKKLKKSLKGLGLLYPLVWNKSTGNLVCGHQRLSIIDELKKTSDYELTMSVVTLTEKQEVIANVTENNRNLMGDFDTDGIKSLLSDGFSFKDFEFTENDMNLMEIDLAADFFEQETQEVKADVEEIKKMKAARKQFKEEANLDVANDNYVCVIFKSLEEKTNFLSDYKIDSDTKYLSSSILKSILNQTVSNVE